MRSAPGFDAEWLVRCLAGGPAIGYCLDDLRAFAQLFFDFAQQMHTEMDCPLYDFER